MSDHTLAGFALVALLLFLSLCVAHLITDLEDE